MRYELVVGELVLLFWSLDADVSFTIEAHTDPERLWIDLDLHHGAADDVMAYVATQIGHEASAWSEIQCVIRRVVSPGEKPQLIAQGYLRKLTSRALR